MDLTFPTTVEITIIRDLIRSTWTMSPAMEVRQASSNAITLPTTTAVIMRMSESIAGTEQLHAVITPINSLRLS